MPCLVPRLCLEMDPDQPDIHAARAEIFAELGQTERGAHGIRSRHRASTARQSPCGSIGRCCTINKGHYDLALADMNDVIASEPRTPLTTKIEPRYIQEAMQRSDLCQRDMDMAERCKELA